MLITLCLLTLLGGCKGREENREEQLLLGSIEQAWQLCETNLSAAQTQAEVLGDSVRNASELVRQKYNLLAIRLRDKRDIIPSSPDSALRVLQYFTQRSNAVDKERACYYVGSAYRDLKDYPQAVNYFLKATDAARQGKDADTLLWQNALSQLSHLYILLLNYEEELNVAMQSVELAKASQRNLAFYLADVATAYQNLNDTLLCLQYLDEAHRAIRQENFHPRYGRTLAYTSDSGGVPRVYAMDVATRVPRRLVWAPDIRESVSPEFSCTGKLTFCGRSAGRYRIYVTDPARDPRTTPPEAISPAAEYFR